MVTEWRRKRERIHHFKEKMSLEEAHHNMRPWINTRIREKKRDRERPHKTTQHSDDREREKESKRYITLIDEGMKVE